MLPSLLYGGVLSLSLSPALGQVINYTPWTLGAHIPFKSIQAGEVPFTNAPRVSIQVGSGATLKTFSPVVDTGTTGLGKSPGPNGLPYKAFKT